MAFTDKIDLYTQALNVSFIRAYEAISEPPPIAKALTIVPSKGRVENYPWMFPPPLMHEWNGYRQYATLGTTNYRVPNRTYTAEFEVPYEDLEDDQISGFQLQAANLAEGAKVFRTIQSQVTLAAGQTTTCVDGDNFFSAARSSRVIPWNFATGGNILTGTASGTDSVTHAMVVLLTGNKMVKPLLWQDREPAHFQTDAGSKESEKVRMVKWWTNMRGAACFGFPWDALLIKFANTPTVADLQTTLGNVIARFRSFTYPKNLTSDPNQYIHGQLQFTADKVMIVCSSLIEHIARQALTLSLIAQTENYFKGMADLVCSGYLDAVV